MKKLILSVGAMAFLASAIFVSCKKDNKLTSPVANKKNVEMKTISTTSINVSIDERGFLVFATTEDVGQYVMYLQSHSLDQVKDFQKSKGFNSLAGEKYDALDQSSLVTEEQVKDFTLDVNGLVEVNGTVFKPTSNNLSLLTIQKSRLDERNFTAIVNESFDESTMNQFAVNKVREEGFDLFKTIEKDEFGISEGQIMYPGGGQASLMKFWGTTESAGPCDETGYQLVTVTHWAFWMKAGYDWYYRPCVN